MADFEDNIVPEFAFHDISHRASVFRTRLIEEFQLLDNIVESNSVQSPQYTTKDMRGIQRWLFRSPLDHETFAHHCTLHAYIVVLH